MRSLATLAFAALLAGAAIGAWAAYWYLGHPVALYAALFLTVICLVVAIRIGGSE